MSVAYVVVCDSCGQNSGKISTSRRIARQRAEGRGWRTDSTDEQLGFDYCPDCW